MSRHRRRVGLLRLVCAIFQHRSLSKRAQPSVHVTLPWPCTDLPPNLTLRSFSLCGCDAFTIAIPLQVYGVLPAATVFMLGYSKVSTLLSKRALFYATALPFFAFFLFFKLIMYPMRASLHPSEAAVAMLAGLPEGMSYVVKLYRNWTFALFYVVSELYSSVRFQRLAACAGACSASTPFQP